MLNNRTTGTAYEDIAAKWLTSQGMKIICRNFRCRLGEIDLVGFIDGYLVFVEVKYRKSNKIGTPEEAVGIAKQRKICQVADYYRLVNKYSEQTSVRYDVIAICDNQVKWYPNAFMHQYTKYPGRSW